MNGREPEGGRWNFDADNRQGYPAGGPVGIPDPVWFEPDRITQQVFALVERHFPDHPGSLANFRWPVTREQALLALQRFVQARLPRFGPNQDAMWTATPWGWHALLATSLNLHLLDPREVIAAADGAAVVVVAPRGAAARCGRRAAHPAPPRGAPPPHAAERWGRGWGPCSELEYWGRGIKARASAHPARASALEHRWQ